jgi:AcrR family transcriptional regulator
MVAAQTATTTLKTAGRRAPAKVVSHNLNGQRLGRKGRDTRDRILAVAKEIVEDFDEAQITISEVARRANLRMASLYVYFADLTELGLALLEPVMAEAETSYLELLRTSWPDSELAPRCNQFVQGFYAFWQRNSGILHLRNTMADRKDQRMTDHRINAARPVIAMLVEQMGHDAAERGSPAVGMATVLYMGFERAVNIATDRHFGDAMGERFAPDIEHYMEAEARLFELAIADYRAKRAV